MLINSFILFYTLNRKLNKLSLRITKKIMGLLNRNLIMGAVKYKFDKKILCYQGYKEIKIIIQISIIQK